VRTTFLKWMVVVGGACLATAIIHPRLARSADHLDAPATTADHPADINDVYAFLPSSELAAGTATHTVFVMTVFPAAPADAKFSDAVQYVLHAQSGAGFPTTTADYNIICTFDAAAAQKAQCWGGTDEYATGDASQPAGISSADGKLKVFAGLRADPFFFNLDGFKDTVATVDAVVDAGGVTFNDAGCPNNITGGQSSALVGKLGTTPTTGGAPGTAVDFFKKLNGLAIVVQVDTTLVTKGGPIVSVWGSTHQKS
jgi:hypothetical protein